MKVLKFDNCEYLTEITDVSCLPNLENLSFQKCENLTTIDSSVGSLNKLKILDAYGCIKLESFPPLKLASLERLVLSCCKSLQSFPEILCKIEILRHLDISETSINEFPPSFQNLTGVEQISKDEMFSLPSFISEMPKLKTITLFHGLDKLSMPKSRSTMLSNLEFLGLCYCNLSYECLQTLFLWFSNVKYLHLQRGNSKILPECLKECFRLEELELNHCKNLEERRGIPPNLGIFAAPYYKPLNFSSKSTLPKMVILLFISWINI
jgi:Leucine-rich repeat (LRR) protein